MKQNLEVSDIKLTDEEMASIASLDKSHSAFDWNIMDNFDNPDMIKILNDTQVHD